MLSDRTKVTRDNLTPRGESVSPQKKQPAFAKRDSEKWSGKGGAHKMKAKVLLAFVALSYLPSMVVGNEAAYPKEKVAAFVVEKLDLTSLPSAFRPKKEKGKKTVADYGFTAQKLDGNEAIIETGEARRLAIQVLDQNSSGIYVCVAEPGNKGGDTKAQSVVLLKRKDPNSLLKGRESFREFAVCPVIGGIDYATSSDGD
jgi:hypothetical protein